VSSILKALKKLDKNTDPPPASTAGAIQPRRSMHRLFQPHRRPWPWGLGLVAVLLVTVALYVVGSWKSADIQRLPSVQAPLKAVGQPPSKMAVPRPRARKAIVSPPPLASHRKATGPTTEGRRPQGQVAAAQPDLKKPAPPPSAPLRARTAPPAEPVKIRPSILPKRIQPSALPKKPPAPASLKPLPADAGLTLQALVWAPEPERRFTVINNQIVREGGSVDGMTVMRIEETQVVLRKDGVLWTLSYDHR
jgi:Type II secretion system protein B